ncbi:MAG: hypothetical protein RLZZ490_2494, partial [Cyanobacteriota bacterium]
MESLFLVLGIIGGLIAGFAITYFAFVGKLQKKLASAKKKLDRAQSANEEADTLQSQLDAQKSERQAAESQLAALEAAHQAQIRDLEAELESLRQSSVSLEQIPPDHSEELAALQNRLAEVEQNHQETLQSRLAEVEHQHQEAVQALQARHQDELESLRQSLTVAPPFPTPETATERITEETESLATEPTPGNWGTAAIAGGAAAIGAGIAALSNFGESLSPETTDAISEEGDRELAVEPLELPEVVAVVESETPDFPELTEEFSSTEDSQPSPFEQTDVFDTDSFAAPPGAEAEDLSPFAPPEAPVTDENWVDMPDSLVSSEEIMAGRDIFDEEEVLPPLAIDTPVAFGSTVPLGIETDNWVDIPDNVERIDNEFETSEFETGEPPAALLPDFSETAETGLLDVDNLLADGGETGTFTAELPDMEEGEDVGLGLELPDMTEEPDLGEFSFEDQTLEELGDDGPDGDALLAALTGTGQEEPSLGFFALEETTAENEVIEEDLSLLSNAGDTLEMPDSFLADIPSFIPDADSDTEDMA